MKVSKLQKDFYISLGVILTFGISMIIYFINFALLDKYGDNYIYEIFKELNCDRYNKYGQQLISINDYEYQLLLNNAIRFLDKLNNYLYYLILPNLN